MLSFCALAISGCEYNNLANCYHGKVIMTSCCTGSTFISLDLSTPIGKNTKLNGQDYANVIQVPGYLNQAEVYMNLRKFDSSKDSNLFPPYPAFASLQWEWMCPCLWTLLFPIRPARGKEKLLSNFRFSSSANTYVT